MAEHRQTHVDYLWSAIVGSVAGGAAGSAPGDLRPGQEVMDSLVQPAARVRSVQELAELLRALRRRHARHSRDSQLSYRELAARTGWSHAAIAEYMTGRTLPPTDRLDALMRVLGATAVELGAAATARDRIEESRRSGHTTEPSPGDRVGDKLRGGVAAVPRQLPAVAPHFVGRSAELAGLSDVVDRPPQAGTVVISAVAGMAGIGKTALAVHAGHRLAEHFPDGQVFVDLHGFTAGMPRMQPAQALDRLLRDVGVPGDQIPSGLEQRAALWRSVLAGRRMLIVLDNAAAEDQVMPLLPGAAGCLVLVTSRRHLTGLETTHAVSLDTLPQQDAVTLFLRTAGRPELSAGTPDMAQAPEVLQVVELCGRLPLAIRIAAGRLKHRRVWTVADLLARLHDIAGLDALDDGQRSVHATLNLSYQHLSADAQRLYRLLGLHPGPDVDVYTAAALTASTLDEARRLLDGLVDDHMLQEPHLGRFQFHDLVRAHAADLATGQETSEQQQTALIRLLDYHRHTAAAAMAVAYPHRRQRRPRVPPALTPTPDLHHRSLALRWLDTELANLLATTQHAAQYGSPEHTWHLSATLGEHLLTRGRHRESEALYRHALTLALSLGNRQAEIDALNGLGIVERMFGRYRQAGEHLLQAAQIAQDTGDRVGELHALNGLGNIRAIQGDQEQADDHLSQALRIAQDIGDRAGELQARSGLGHVRLTLGRYEPAGDHLRQALQIAVDTGDRTGELQALTSLGSLHRLLGHESQAASLYEQALQRARDLDSPNWEFEALQGLGRLHHAAGHPDRALTHYEQALQCATDLAQPTDQARAHDGLAHAHHALNRHDQARQHWQHALDILTGLGTDHTDEVETSLPTLRAHLTNLDEQQSITTWTETTVSSSHPSPNDATHC